MTVVLIGQGDSEEFELLSDAIEHRGGESLVCDVTQWPGDTPLTYDPSEDGVTLGSRIEFDDVTSAYVSPSRLFQPGEVRFSESMSQNLRPTLNQLREHRAMFESVCYTFDERGVDIPRVDAREKRERPGVDPQQHHRPQRAAGPVEDSAELAGLEHLRPGGPASLPVVEGVAAFVIDDDFCPPGTMKTGDSPSIAKAVGKRFFAHDHRSSGFHRPFGEASMAFRIGGDYEYVGPGLFEHPLEVGVAPRSFVVSRRGVGGAPGPGGFLGGIPTGPSNTIAPIGDKSLPGFPIDVAAGDETAVGVGGNSLDVSAWFLSERVVFEAASYPPEADDGTPDLLLCCILFPIHTFIFSVPKLVCLALFLSSTADDRGSLVSNYSGPFQHGRIELSECSGTDLGSLLQIVAVEKKARSKGEEDVEFLRCLCINIVGELPGVKGEAYV